MSQKREGIVLRKMQQEGLFLHEQMQYYPASLTLLGLLHTLPPLLLHLPGDFHVPDFILAPDTLCLHDIVSDSRRRYHHLFRIHLAGSLLL